MSDGWDEISGGHEPDRDRPPRRRLLPARSPMRSASAWMPGHRRLVGVVAVVAVVAVTMLGTGLWAWQRAHRVALADRVHVRVDPSEYFLPGELDARGQSDLLMLLRVDVAAGVGGPVRLVGLAGGGISTGDEHALVGPSAKVTVQTRLSCDQWAGGKGIRVRLLVGPGQGQPVEVPLTGPSSTLGAQVTAPCAAFDRTHPLRMTAFSVSPQPNDPVVRTTWRVVNRSAVPITLADELAVGAFGSDPPLVAQAPTETTVLAAHGTATVSRDVAVASCAQTLDPFGTLVTLTGRSDQSAAGDPIIDVTLSDQSVADLYDAAKDVCLGAPDLSAARATVTLHRGPPGKGRADLAVEGRVEPAGGWTVQLESQGGLDPDPPVPVPAPVMMQRVDGPGPFALTAGWVVRSCSAGLASADRAPATVAVTVSGLRTYPYVLPITYTGRTDCAPGDVRG